MKKLIVAVAITVSSLAFASQPASKAAPAPAQKPAAQAPAAPATDEHAGIEPAVRALIPEGYVSETPVKSRTGKLERMGYFIHKKGAPDSHGFYPVPVILVETIDGKISVHEKLGTDWGWTGIRKARSAGLGDPHHDIELREFDNGKESRIVAFSDGRRLLVAREGGPQPLTIRPTKDDEIQLVTVKGRHALIERTGKKVTVFTLNGETFSADAELTKLAAGKGVRALPDLSVKWTSARDLKK
ncbi:MAG: hypothetical protein ACK4N5_00915 [Myxococcales bacterium]